MHCREIARLIDSDAVPDLRWVDRVQLRVHLWVCYHCRVLVRQVRLLRELAKARMAEPAAGEAGLENRILQKLL